MSSDIYRYGVTILVLAGTMATAKIIDVRPAEALVRPLDSIGMEIDGWKGTPDPPIRQDILDTLAPTSYLSTTYNREGETLSLFIAYYANQRAGESMHSPKHCLPGTGWDIVNYGVADLKVGGREVEVNRHTIEKDAERMAVLYWYQSPRRIIASEYMAKLYLVRDAVVERRTGGAIVRIICRENPRTVQEAIAFGEAVAPRLQYSMTGTTAFQNWK